MGSHLAGACQCERLLIWTLFLGNINYWRHPTHASRTSFRLKKYLLEQILFPSKPIIWIGNPSPSERTHTSVKYWSATSPLPPSFAFKLFRWRERGSLKIFDSSFLSDQSRSLRKVDQKSEWYVVLAILPRKKWFHFSAKNFFSLIY